MEYYSTLDDSLIYVDLHRVGASLGSIFSELCRSTLSVEFTFKLLIKLSACLLDSANIINMHLVCNSVNAGSIFRHDAVVYEGNQQALMK